MMIKDVVPTCFARSQWKHIKRILVATLTLSLLLGADALAGRRSSSGGGRSSFGGGRSSFGSSSSRPSFGGGSSRPSSSPSSSRPSGSRPSFGGGSSSSGNKPSFEGGSSNKTVTRTPIPGKTPTSVSKKPLAPSFDTLAGKESKKAASRANYEKAQAAAPSYKTPAGQEQKLDAKDKKIEYLRGRLDQQKWVNRQQREDVFYRSYSSRPVIVYNDCYHPMWNYWLLSHSIDTMALWVYHHQHSMDVARMNYLYAQNANLRARVQALEAQKLARDPTYTPAGVDADMAYNDGYVNAVYNPRPKMVNEYEYAASSAVGWVLLWIFVIIPLGCLVLWGIAYLLFIKRWSV